MTTKMDKATGHSKAADIVEESDVKADSRKICGIVMPIAAMGDEYTEAHWGRVRRVLQRAIDRAGLRSQLVWENPEVDVIQTAILQNLFENDIVICDVSNLNPNVMLETGLRLSTRRPTIIVTDRVKRPPFDISTIAYIDYPQNLEYNATEEFISKLSRKIGEFIKADEEDKYKPYIEQFRFETVKPDSVTVTTDEYVKDRLDDLAASLGRLVRAQENSTERGSVAPKTAVRSPKPRTRYVLAAAVEADLDQEHATRAEVEIDALERTFCSVDEVGQNKFSFRVFLHPEAAIGKSLDEVTRDARQIINSAEESYLFG